MAWAKAKTVVLVGAGVLLAAGVTSTIVFRNDIRYQFTLAEGRSALTRHEATPLDLRRQSRDFDAKNDGPPWDTIPMGFQVFDHVPLQIDSLITLWGGRNAAGGGGGGGATLPEAVEGIEVNQRFEALYIYHTAFFASPGNMPVCAVVLHYEDGSSATNQLLYGADILEWAGNPSKRANIPKKSNHKTANDPTGPNSGLAWLGGTFTPGEYRPVRFCLTEVANPRPSLKVDAIGLYSCKSPSAPCIMAMTVGKAGLMK